MEQPTLMKEILVYDAECALCRNFKTRIERKVPGMHFLKYSKAQKLLKAQYGLHPPFTLFVFTPLKVYSSGRAASYAINLAGEKSLCIEKYYTTLANVISLITGRKKITHPTGGDEQKLTEDAKKELQKLFKPKISEKNTNGS